jgi:hypothetical protein
MVIDPVFPARDERYRRRLHYKVCAILSHKDEVFVEDISVNMVNDSRGTVVWIHLLKISTLFAVQGYPATI